MLARPTVWDDDRGRPPRIYVAPDHRSRAVLAMGERALARAKLCDDGSYEAHVIRKLDRQPQRVLGVYEIGSEGGRLRRSEEHTSELQSLMRISYAVFCLKKKKNKTKFTTAHDNNKH